MAGQRKQYEVLVPFPHHRGAWTRKGQVLELLECEAAQLRRVGRIKAVTPAAETTASKTTTKATKD